MLSPIITDADAQTLTTQLDDVLTALCDIFDDLRPAGPDATTRRLLHDAHDFAERAHRALADGLVPAAAIYLEMSRGLITIARSFLERA